MQPLQDMFINTVHTIIQQELSDIQQEQFAIEGEETIISLFNEDKLPQYDNKDMLFDFGISPEGLELEAIGITFLDVIKACHQLIKTVRNGNTQSDWSEIMQEQGTQPLLSDLLCKKYASSLKQIVALP